MSSEAKAPAVLFNVLITLMYASLAYLAIGVNYTFLPAFGFHDAQRVCLISLQIAAIFSAAYVLAGNQRAAAYSRSKQNEALILILLLCLGISSITSSCTHFGLVEIFNFAALAVLSFSFRNTVILKSSSNTIRIVIITFTLALVLYVFIFTVSYFSALMTSLSMDVDVFFHGFSNRRFFNQIQVWMLPLLTLPLLFKLAGVKGLSRYSPGFSALLCINIVLLIFSSARGASLALLSSLPIILTLIKPIAGRLMLSVAMLAIAAFAAYWVLFIVIPPYFGFTITDMLNIRTDSSGRVDLWRTCLDMIKQSPFFGAGPMAFAAIPNAISVSHPHNSLLQLAAEWGLIATAIVVFFYSKGLLAFWRLCRNQSVPTERRMYRVALLWSFLAASIYSLLCGVIVMPMSQLLGALIIGLMLAEYRAGQIAIGANTLALPVAARRAMAISLLLFGGLYLWLLWPQIEQRLSATPDYMYSLSNQGPRFWQDGGVPLNGGNR